ncbi:hypothetical protein OSB04_018539 [Centaurea solstitialis]|uniref:Alpha-galactosidase n=1 Tax=Centaurea solstitialis TaxID=347529 RepID=A0AA38WLU7_9ASTR|nr:hypothetical protein OSB04_018539 [Centaurea solstitialis]
MLCFRVLSEIHASLPPRGWNSYDSFCWTVSEDEFLQNAQLLSQKLHAHGYEYAVVDYLWYRKLVPGAYVDSLGYDVIDEWGRVIPDPGRWPSSKGGKGFTEVAKKVHDMGLKFGFHIMRGISTQAVNANTPILDITTGKAYVESGKVWHAKDIGIKERACAWMTNGFMSVDTSLGAGRAFLRSLHHQYAEWNVDFVKHDCVFGDDLDLNEIKTVSEILKGLDRPIVYSLSPGTSVTPAMAKQVAPLVNMYRVTGDDWDNWGDVAAHFDVSRDFAAASMVGSQGLLGSSWPDLDMLPLGWLTDPGSNEGPHRMSRLSLDEQKTQMTLWSMARSPLMFGGDMRKLDDATYGLLTNPILLEINSFSSNNKEAISLYYKHIGPTILGARSEFSNEKLKRRGDEGVAYSGKYEGKFHLRARNGDGFCFDTSSKRRLTSKERKRASFSPCRPDTNQMWELSENGTLVNGYSGLCASIKATKANASPGGIRSWIAAGKKGKRFCFLVGARPLKRPLRLLVRGLNEPRVWSASYFAKCKEHTADQLGGH